jgi:flavin reductase (DIM6/NTAB) family NADH-FMN oxidoreductase RutF
MFYRYEDGHGLPHDPLKAIVAPRPIGWISSRSKEGKVNLAPYSFFNMISTQALSHHVLFRRPQGQRLLYRRDG